MGFSIKLAPGVRVRASSRGVRTSLGPRVARLHLGSGRPAVSTGTGPVGYYTSIGGSRDRTSSGGGSARQQVAAATRQRVLADKTAEAERLRQAFAAIAALHREEFPAARRLVAPPPPDPPIRQFRDLYRQQAVRGISFFDRAARREALKAAEGRVDAAVLSARAELARQAAQHQADFDADWAALLACEPDIVLHVLNDAFANNQAPAAAVGIEGNEISLLVVVPPERVVPDRKPGLTAAGNISLKKLTKTEAADVYKQLVCGHLVATLKEAFAVAPGVESARVAAIRASPDAYGTELPEVMVAARCARSDLAEVRWEIVDAVRVVNDCCTEKVLVQKGVTRTLQPVALGDQPELRALVDAVDLSELAGDR